jgi:cell division protein FtsZ
VTTLSRQRKVIGVGNAGVGILDRLIVETPGISGLMIINNDHESLGASIVREKISLPKGDPRDGFLMIEEEFSKSIEGSLSILLCGGLGGGTTSLLIPLLAARAKTMGIVTLGCVSLPFGFEGKQKKELAHASLKKLQGVCDAVAVIENDRLTGSDPTKSTVGSAFQISDELLLSSMKAIQGMIATAGPVKITRHDLATVLGKAATLHFGHGRSEGANRLHEALERALHSPLMKEKGGRSVIGDARMILLLLRGPNDLSFAEMQVAVEDIERMAGKGCVVKVGVDTTAEATAGLEVFIMAASDRSELSLERKSPEEVARDASPATTVSIRTKKETSAKSKLTTPAAKSTATYNQTQGMFELNPYQRGRFDKSEPTIFDGEDLDVPTFLRRGIKLVFPPK